MKGPMICHHSRMRSSCEDCKLLEAMDRGQGLPPPSAAPRKRQVAETDLKIERTDLDTDSFVLVNKGDLIPLELEDLPRKPTIVVEAPPAPKGERGRAREAVG